MSHVSSNPPSGRETFTSVITSEFRFLLDRGFALVVECADAVRYEAASGAFVRVFRDPRDQYVGFRVGLQTRPRDALTAPELARLMGAQSQGEYPDNFFDLRTAAAKLARLLRDYGDRALAGDETILDEAMALRREYTSSYTRPEPPDQSPKNKP